MKKHFFLLIAAAEMGFAESENVALHKTYTLSPTPNYSYCTDPGDAAQLTDGVYSEGYFWTQKSTVGWSGVAPVLVAIDLGETQPIRGVSWSCAAGVAGVTWPECLYVLVSEDRKTWTCLGDLCELGTVERLPPEKGYAQFRFATDRMKGLGRYVCVVADARPFCFVDEIEVWRGEDAWLQGETSGRRTDDPRAFYLESRVRSGVAYRLRTDARTILEHARGLGPSVRAAVQPALDAVSGRIQADADGANGDRPTVLPYSALHEELLALHAPVLRAAGVKTPLVWRCDRWAPLTLTALPPAGRAAAEIALDLMRGEVRGEVFNLTNPDGTALPVDVWVEGLPPGANIELRDVLVTDTQTREPVATALRPPDAGAQAGHTRLTVPAGCTRQVWVSCRRPTCPAGVYRGAVRLAADGGRFAQRVPLTLHVRALDFPARPTLHVGGWDYVQGAADYYRAPGNLAANLALMRDLYVDSPWATAAVFPKGAAFDGGGALTNEAALDFSVWDAWVVRWHGARKYCVFFDVGAAFDGEKMGTPRFRAMVGSWLAAWVRHLTRQGLTPDQCVILLVDEPHERMQDAVIVAWASAIRAAKLGVQLFEDPTYEAPEKGDPAMFAASDILCPNTPMMQQRGEAFRAFYRGQQKEGKTLWLYSCSGPTKLLDPVAYHRAQAWLAFQMGAEGSFYWAFGCGGGIGDSWHAYKQAYAEYSPYFVGPDSVMESKHSEAIREGVQDYEYLRLLRDAVGRVRATGKDPHWVSSAETVLTDGVAEAVRVATPSNLFWRVEKDRSAMDAVRVRILDLLESAPSR